MATFRGLKYDTKLLPKGLPHSLFASTASSIHAQYDTNRSRKLPNRTSNTLLAGLNLYLNGCVIHDDTTSVIEFETNSKTLLVRCWVQKNRLTLKAGYIDDNGVITAISKSQTSTDEAMCMCAVILPYIQDSELSSLVETKLQFIKKVYEDPEKEYPYSDEETADISIFSDNVYRRSKDTYAGPAPLHINDTAGTIFQTDLSLPFMSTGQNLKYFQYATSSSDFLGEYRYQERTFTEEEKKLIPTIPDGYVMPDFVRQTCHRFKATSNFPAPMRTALFCGPAGAGKTEGSRAVAAGLGLPYMHYTCSDGTEILDLIGQVMPAGSQESISLDEIRKMLNLPSTEEIINDPDPAYEKVFGKPAPVIYDVSEIIEETVKRTVAQVRNGAVGGKDFVYIESDFIRAVRNGYVFEIQEVDMIKRSSLIVGLNALLESGHNAFLTLPTGETVTKHPDCTILFTDNGNYEGARKLNQAILSRMSMVYLLEGPTKNEMFQRTMNRLHFPNEKILNRMVTVIRDIQEYCRNEEITDGVCGQRELENWAMAIMVDAGDMDITDELVHDCAIETVINKTSQDPYDVARIQTACLDKEFVG